MNSTQRNLEFESKQWKRELVEQFCYYNSCWFELALRCRANLWWVTCWIIWWNCHWLDHCPKCFTSCECEEDKVNNEMWCVEVGE